MSRVGSHVPAEPASGLVVSEVFGPTVQGEGPTAGKRCAFVRLGRCNLSCSWCDTPYTWDWRGANGTVYDPATELHRSTVADVVAQVRKLGVNRLVVSGGEPLLQRAGLQALVGALPDYAFEVETNGTRPPLDWWHDLHYNVSPKLANSGMAEHVRIRPAVLERFSAIPCAAFKFVVTEPADLDEVDKLAATYGWSAERVWIMPEARDAGTLDRRLGELADEVIARGYNLTGRLQVAVWGDRRGV